MSSRYTTHPVSDEKWYEEKCKDFLDGKCDFFGHTIDKVGNLKSDEKGNATGHILSGINPLENPEYFSFRKFCNKCSIKFRMSLLKENALRSNCGFHQIKNRAELYLCPECHKDYLREQDRLKKKGLLTDIEIDELAKKVTKHPYGWEYQLGFIDGYIEMRDGKSNILSENKWE